jgi:hypothetical protein
MFSKLDFRVAAVLMVAVVACSGGAEERQAEDVVELFVPWGDIDAEDRLSEELHDAVEAIIDKCMDEAGFEYVPVSEDSVAFGPGHGISRSDYARNFGFGISTNDETLAAADTYSGQVGDPNFDYVRTLAPEREIAWGHAYDACESRSRDVGPNLSAGFHDAVAGMVDRVRAEPSVIEAEEEWVACLEAGIPSGLPMFSSLDDLVAWFYAESEARTETPGSLAELQELEREVAVRHLECHPPLVEAMREAALSHEPDIVGQYQEEIDAILEFING